MPRLRLGVPDLAAARELRWGVVRATTEGDLVNDAIRPDEERHGPPQGA